ncbi:MAG: restriction endonuclease subunit S [Chitinophagales bacterium]
MKKTNNALIPKLRFPEFKKDGEWENWPFNDLFQNLPTNTLSRENLNPSQGQIKNIHYGDIHTKFQILFDSKRELVPYINDDAEINILKEDNLCKEGDLIFADASEDIKDVGKSIVVYKTHGEKIVAGMHTLLARPKTDRLFTPFTGYLFHSSKIKSFIQKESQGTKVYGISGTRLGNILINFPHSPLEQQKIADCLSSLDDLLSASKQKLEALQQHKKALLQNLFPASGQTVPKWRFKGFKGGWEEKQLDSEIGEFFKGRGIAKSDIVPNGKTPCIRYGELYTIYGEVIQKVHSYTNQEPQSLFFSEKYDVLLPSSGETKEDIATASCVMFSGIALGGDINVLRPKINGAFLAYYLTHNRKTEISKIAQGDSVVHLYSSQLQKLHITFPKPSEQQKIADCLSSADALITARQQQIEMLQLHKKGLMQGLFPSI